MHGENLKLIYPMISHLQIFIFRSSVVLGPPFGKSCFNHHKNKNMRFVALTILQSLQHAILILIM